MNSHPQTIKIRYLYNSGFTIETRDHFLILDYYRGDLTLPTNKKVLFVVTHGHEDHYNPEIFHLPGAETAHYVLSDDIRPVRQSEKLIRMSRTLRETQTVKTLYTSRRVRRAHPGEAFEWDGVAFRTFGSTDLGLSIYFQLDGISFFHAGDLNAWKWPSFSEAEQKKEVEDYQKILDQIRPYPVDIAFGVVDPRLGEAAFLGPDRLIDTLSPQIFIPMHFREDTAITQRYAAHQKDHPITRVQVIHQPNDLLLIES